MTMKMISDKDRQQAKPQAWLLRVIYAASSGGHSRWSFPGTMNDK